MAAAHRFDFVGLVLGAEHVAERAQAAAGGEPRAQGSDVARGDAGTVQLLLPAVLEVQQALVVGREQGQPAVAGQVDRGQGGLPAVDGGQRLVETEVPHRAAGTGLVVGDQHAEDLALQRAQRFARRVGHGVELVAAVEPDAVEAAVQGFGVEQQADHPSMWSASTCVITSRSKRRSLAGRCRMRSRSAG